MFNAVSSPWLIPHDGSFEVEQAACAPPPDAPSTRECRQRLAAATERLDELQRLLFASGRWSVLLVFQALDAAGKDGTIRAVLTGVNPAGCQVHSFQVPNAEELAHDFLWRTARRLPERGRIGVFNRSYYEEVLVVRVHEHLLDSQSLPFRATGGELWRQRFESIVDHERHLARNGMVVLKFWLNISADEQRRRFLSRLRQPEKHWKFSHADLRDREHRQAYLAAYQEMLNASSRPWAPWYAIPADSKPYMRMEVAELIVAALSQLDLAYPEVTDDDRKQLADARAVLEDDKRKNSG